MRIVQIINNLSGGGAERLLVNLSISLAERGHQVFVLVLGKRYGIYEERLESKGICVKVLNKKKYDPRVVGQIASFINKNKIDVVHSHLFPTQYFVALARKRVDSEVRFLTTEHSAYNLRRFFLFRHIDSFFYSKYDDIVGITPQVNYNLETHLIGDYTNRMRLIPNGVNLNAVNDAIPVAKLSDAAINVVQVGRFELAKRQDLTIRALKILIDDGVDVHVSFVGVGSLLKESKSLVTELKLDDRVSFLGFRKDVFSIMKSADILVMPSDWEGLSLAAIEGIASGTPFVATSVPGLREIVEGVGVLVEKGSSEDLALKMKMLIEDDKQKEMLSIRGLEKAKQYDINIMVDKYIELYEKA